MVWVNDDAKTPGAEVEYCVVAQEKGESGEIHCCPRIRNEFSVSIKPGMSAKGATAAGRVAAGAKQKVATKKPAKKKAGAKKTAAKARPLKKKAGKAPAKKRCR